MVFGQITLKLSMFWTAAMLMEAMCYSGILEITFWAAHSGIADAGVALLGCSLPTCFQCQCFLCSVFITSCSMGWLVQEWTSNIQSNFFYFLPNKLQLHCYCQVSRPLEFSPFQCSKWFISHVSRFLFRKSQWLIKSRKDIMGKCVHGSFSSNSF